MRRFFERSWDEYGYKLKMMIDRPRANGSFEDDLDQDANIAQHTTVYGDEKYGRRITFVWRVREDAGSIVECGYFIFGSPDLMAIAEMAAMLCKNKTFDEIRAINYKTLEYFLRDRPSEEVFFGEKRGHILFVAEALSYSMDILEKKEISSSDTEVICECTGAHMGYIKRAIEAFDIEDISYLREMTHAGVYCGKCVKADADFGERSQYLEDILRETRKAIAHSGTRKPSVPDKPFGEMSVDEKRAAIDSVIDEHIRSMLVMDGGDMEILDVKENGINTDIYIRYLGACSGCASANTGTLFAIEGVLRQKLDKDIRVLPV